MTLARRLRADPVLRVGLQITFIIALALAYTVALWLLPDLRRTLPGLSDLVAAAGALFSTPAFWAALAATLASAATGFAIAMVVGIVVGVLLSVHRHAYASARFVIDFMRTIPPLVLIPVGLLIAGPTASMEISLIVFTATWPVLIQVYYGISHIEPKLLEAAHSFRVPGWRQTLFVKIPAIAPSVSTAARFTATLCLLVAVGTELIAMGTGLGSLIRFYQQANRLPESLVIIAITGVVGLGIAAILSTIERRTLTWHRSEDRA